MLNENQNQETNGVQLVKKLCAFYESRVFFLFVQELLQVRILHQMNLMNILLHPISSQSTLILLCVIVVHPVELHFIE
jgi:hypothetical protein